MKIPQGLKAKAFVAANCFFAWPEGQLPPTGVGGFPKPLLAGETEVDEESAEQKVEGVGHPRGKPLVLAPN